MATFRPAMKEWAEFLAKPGYEGGFSARDVSEEVVPEVLRRLDDDSDRGATRARGALREICRRRARELLTGVIPQLLKRPMSERRADALGAVADVAAAATRSSAS